MLRIDIVACCPVDLDEIVASSLEQAMCDIEESIGLLLYQMFDVVLLEQVSITVFSPEEIRENHSLPVAKRQSSL